MLAHLPNVSVCLSECLRLQPTSVTHFCPLAHIKAHNYLFDISLFYAYDTLLYFCLSDRNHNGLKSAPASAQAP